MKYGFPQPAWLANLSIIGDNGLLYEAGQLFASYPHLWINLWIKETASDMDFLGIMKSFLNIFNRLDKEASDRKSTRLNSSH